LVAPTRQDLARHAKDWAAIGVTSADDIGGGDGVDMVSPNTRGPDKNSTSTATLTLKKFFETMREMNFIQDSVKNITPERQYEIALQLALKILTEGFVPEFLERSVVYADRKLWGFETSPLRENNQDDDEDDDEEEDTGTAGREQINQARASALRGQRIYNILYNAIMIELELDRVVGAGGNPKADPEVKLLVGRFKEAVGEVNPRAWTNFNSVLKNRLNGEVPSNRDRTAIPVSRGDSEEAIEVPQSSPGFRLVQQFFTKYRVTAHGNLADYVNAILKNNLPNVKEMKADFITVTKNPDVMAVIRQETQELLNNLTEDRNPVTKLNEEAVNEYLTLLYWTFYLYAIKYEGGEDTHFQGAVLALKKVIDHIRPNFFDKMPVWIKNALVDSPSPVTKKTKASPKAQPVANTLEAQPVSQVFYQKYPNARELISKLKATYGEKELLQAWATLTLGQFEERYFPSADEQRVRKIISMARANGAAKDEELARQEIAGYWDESDEDIVSVLSECSSILRGILT
jgi:hypothetical protein